MCCIESQMLKLWFMKHNSWEDFSLSFFTIFTALYNTKVLRGQKFCMLLFFDTLYQNTSRFDNNCKYNK